MKQTWLLGVCLGVVVLGSSPTMCAQAGEPAPTPTARIAEVSLHPGTGVSSFWLGNGVRLLHRRTADEPGQIIIRIALVGGEINETALDRGITRAAFESAWGDLKEEGIEAEVEIAPDAAQLVLKTTPARLDEALALGERLISEPSILDAQFTAWLGQSRDHITDRARDPVEVAFDALCAVHVSADQARLRSIKQSDLDQLTIDAVRAHLAAMCARSPVVVSIVGQIDSEPAGMSASEYLGRLGDRPRASSVSLDAPPCAAGSRNNGPITIDSDATTAAIVLGIRSPDMTRIDELRAMIVASQLIDARVRALDGDGDGEPRREHLWSFVDPGELYRGTAILLVADQPAPNRAGARGDAIERVLAQLAEQGPEPDEMDRVRRKIDGFLKNMLGNSRYWSRRLCELERHGRTLDEIVTIRRAYRKIDARFIAEVFERQHAGGVVRVVVIPE